MVSDRGSGRGREEKRRTVHELPRPPSRIRSRMSAPPPDSVRNAQRVTPEEVTILSDSHTEGVLDLLPLELRLSLPLLVGSVPPSCWFGNPVRPVSEDEIRTACNREGGAEEGGEGVRRSGEGGWDGEECGRRILEGS